MSEEMVKKGEEYFQNYQLYVQGVLTAQSGFLLMGEALANFKKHNLWRAAGNHVVSFKHFCEKELHISDAQGHRLAQIYTLLGDILVKIPLDISKITVLLPYLKDKTKEEQMAMLQEAQELTVEDIKNNLRDLQGHPEKATDRCLHAETELVPRCKICQKWLPGSIKV